MNKAQMAALRTRKALNRKAAGQELADLQAEVDRLRAANAELVAMLDTAAQFIDGAAWSGQTFEDCETMTLKIEQAIAKAKGEADNG